MVLQAICSLLAGASLLEIEAGAVFLEFLIGAGELPGGESGRVDGGCRAHILFQQSVLEIIFEAMDASVKLSRSQAQSISEIEVGLHPNTILIIKILKEMRIKRLEIYGISTLYLSFSARVPQQS